MTSVTLLEDQQKVLPIRHYLALSSSVVDAHPKLSFEYSHVKVPDDSRKKPAVRLEVNTEHQQLCQGELEKKNEDIHRSDVQQRVGKTQTGNQAD